eukprot:TRINITY_DN5162_c0_g1_i3.p1 TRINITY_DN5162_c0_g1~~TRINITY_DN5162_c0_g1_i3.p1  ORF type:complete len:238 (+),score=21.11 TRINITY_DN5162_c0_g1_i3:2-715(+)
MRAGARVAFYKRYNQVVHFLEQQQSFRVLFFRVVIVDVLRLVFKVCTGSIEFLLDEISKDDAVFDAIVLPSELIPKQFTLDLYAFYQFDLQKTSNWVLSASDSIDRQTVAQLVKGLLSEDENSWTIPSKQVLLPNRLRYKITPEEYESCGDNTDNCRCRIERGLVILQEDGNTKSCDGKSFQVCDKVELGGSVKLKVVGHNKDCYYRIWSSNDPTTPQWKLAKLKKNNACQFRYPLQ